MARKFLEVAYTPSVLAAQTRYYGRSRPVDGAPDRDSLGPDEQNFIAARDSFYMATVGETGWPYLQHRGGPRGFLRAVDAATLAFADFGGNRQLISVGNLAANDRVALFLMDYPKRARLKLLGRVRIADAREHPELADQLAAAALRAQVERLFFVDVASFDWNCPKYITPRFTALEVEEAVAPLRRQIAELQARLAAASGAEEPGDVAR